MSGSHLKLVKIDTYYNDWVSVECWRNEKKWKQKSLPRVSEISRQLTIVLFSLIYANEINSNPSALLSYFLKKEILNVCWKYLRRPVDYFREFDHHCVTCTSVLRRIKLYIYLYSTDWNHFRLGYFFFILFFSTGEEFTENPHSISRFLFVINFYSMILVNYFVNRSRAIIAFSPFVIL